MTDLTKTRELVTTITTIRVTPESTADAPQYELVTETGVFRTEPGAEINQTLSFGWYCTPKPWILLTLNEHGRVINARKSGRDGSVLR